MSEACREASEGNVWQRRFGGGSPPKRSAPWDFAVAEPSGLRLEAPKATFLEASEGNLRQCRFGAGSRLKRSAPWGFAVAQPSGLRLGLRKLLF